MSFIKPTVDLVRVTLKNTSLNRIRGILPLTRVTIHSGA